MTSYDDKCGTCKYFEVYLDQKWGDCKIKVQKQYWASCKKCQKYVRKELYNENSN